MPTKLYAQWPKCPESAGNTRLVYFRFPLTQIFFNNLSNPSLEFKNGMSFAIYAVVLDKNSKEVHIPLGETVSRSDIAATQNGSQPALHPDQVYFSVNKVTLANTITKIADEISNGQLNGLARIEIHSSLTPCLRKNGCRDFLVNNLKKTLDPNKTGIIHKRDIWVISYRHETHDYNLDTRTYDKVRKEGALIANAARLKNLGAPVNHDPENGTIRCIKQERGGYPCKKSAVVEDTPLETKDNVYAELLRFQAKLLEARRNSLQGPKLPPLVQLLQVRRLEAEGANCRDINAQKAKLKTAAR